MSSDLRSIHRSALQLAFRLRTLLYAYPKGATYRGIAIACGMRSRSGVRSMVLRAEEHGLVEVRSTGRGPRAPKVVQLTEMGRDLVDTFSGDTE